MLRHSRRAPATWTGRAVQGYAVEAGPRFVVIPPDFTARMPEAWCADMECP